MSDAIDVYCSLPHYWEHLEPVFNALPADVRGTVYAPRDMRGQIVSDRPVEWSTPPSSSMPLLVAGFQDLRYARRPKVLLNHGAGQTYKSIDSPSYAGGPGREQADLFLHPNETAAALDRARYPHALSVAVGCPKLDRWKWILKPHNLWPVVAVTFHWNSHIGVPEGSWAWPEWRERIEQLAQRVSILGHAHPRARRELEPWWNSIGVEFIANPIDLLPRADVLVGDTTSLLYEWAACNRPTVWLNSATWGAYDCDGDWRYNTEHGLRFGEMLPGSEVFPACDVDGLSAEIHEAVSGQTSPRIREMVTERVYGPNDTRASERAAAAVMDLIENGPLPRTYTTPKPCKDCG